MTLTQLNANFSNILLRERSFCFMMFAVDLITKATRVIQYVKKNYGAYGLIALHLNLTIQYFVEPFKN